MRVHHFFVRKIDAASVAYMCVFRNDSNSPMLNSPGRDRITRDVTGTMSREALVDLLALTLEKTFCTDPDPKPVRAMNERASGTNATSE
jgi:hypothetical protein